GARGKAAGSSAAAMSIPFAAQPPSESMTEPLSITAIQPLPGEVLSESEAPARPVPPSVPGTRAEVEAAPPIGVSGPFGPAAHEDYDRRGGRGRRDRDRRGKKPKIPSFETKSYESRPEERTYGSLEVLPGESLAKLAKRAEPQPTTPEKS